MTGPEHYRLAERLLEDADEHAHGGDTEMETLTISHAQVHATLAVAAATALTGYGQLPTYDGDAWMNAAASVRPSQTGGQS